MLLLPRVQTQLHYFGEARPLGDGIAIGKINPSSIFSQLSLLLVLSVLAGALRNPRDGRDILLSLSLSGPLTHLKTLAYSRPGSREQWRL